MTRVRSLLSRGHTDGRPGVWGEQGAPQARRGIVFGPGSKIHNRLLHREILDGSLL